MRRTVPPPTEAELEQRRADETKQLGARQAVRRMRVLEQQERARAELAARQADELAALERADRAELAALWDRQGRATAPWRFVARRPG